MQSTKFALKGLVRTSPMFLLVSMVLSFLLMLLIQVFYYSVLFQSLPFSFNFILAIAIGLLTQLARLAFGISGISEFASGKTGKGIAGILFSLALTIFESFEVVGAAATLAKGLENEAILIFQLIVWLGFILEVRLAINVGGSMSEEKKTDVFSSNGATNGAHKRGKSIV